MSAKMRLACMRRFPLRVTRRGHMMHTCLRDWSGKVIITLPRWSRAYECRAECWARALGRFVHRASRTVSVLVSGKLLRRYHNVATRKRWSKGYISFVSLAISSDSTAQQSFISNVRQSWLPSGTRLTVPSLTQHDILYLFAVVDNKCSDKRTISCELTRDDAAVVGGRHGWGVDCLKFSLVQTLIVTLSLQAFADT